MTQKSKGKQISWSILRCHRDHIVSANKDWSLWGILILQSESKYSASAKAEPQILNFCAASYRGSRVDLAYGANATAKQERTYRGRYRYFKICKQILKYSTAVQF